MNCYEKLNSETFPLKYTLGRIGNVFVVWIHTQNPDGCCAWYRLQSEREWDLKNQKPKNVENFKLMIMKYIQSILLYHLIWELCIDIKVERERERVRESSVFDVSFYHFAHSMLFTALSQHHYAVNDKYKCVSTLFVSVHFILGSKFATNPVLPIL